MVLVLELVHESHVVLDRAFREDVESPFRLIDRVAETLQVVIDKVAVALVFPDVDGYPLDLGHHVLHEGRRVDKAEHACAEDEAPYHVVVVFRIRVQSDVADALAGDGKVLGVRGADDAVPVEAQRRGVLEPVVDDFLIRLVVDEEYRPPVFVFLFAQDSGDFLQNRGAVNHTGGVIGGVGKHRLRTRADVFFQYVQSRHEILAGKEGLYDAVMVFDIIEIVHEPGDKDNDFVAGVEDGL